jgi:ketosteroid isomerase-like protein
MKRILISAFFLINCHLIFSQSTFRADRDTVAEQQIKQLEFHLTDLIMKKDIDTYATFLTDDYIRIAANGIVSSKQQVLDGFRKPSNTQGKITPHDLDVRVFGSTAILRATLDIDSNDGTKRSSIITKIFINRNGKWYMASLQGTSLQQ